MKQMSEAVEHRRLRAPREDGGTLIDPPLSAIGDVVEHNVAATAHDYDVQGEPLGRLAAQAREELIDAAFAYTRGYRDVPAITPAARQRVFLAGHQPQLFHPGVWYKNFILSDLGRRHGATAINLAIDSDTIKTASLRVPTGSWDQPLAESLPLDRQTAEIPYEERAIIDRECLDSFGHRAAAAIAPLVHDPLLDEFWPLVSARARECNNLGLCLAQARHQQEGRWGAATLEIPQSQVCSLAAFQRFTCHLLAHLPRLWEVYNRSVADYRRANHIRSTAHPVPDLAAKDDWLEAPFWIWDQSNPRRRRLFVRQRGDEIVLSDRRGLERALALSPEGETHRAAEQLAAWAGEGVRLRTRALITTLFARLFLSDLFLHGIGGAKYDQVTDLIIERFFGLQPPGYVTLTATLRLPISRRDKTPIDPREVNRQLRELTYHPERHLDGALAGSVESLVQEKRRWIATTPTVENARLRCHQIRAVNEALQANVASQREKLLASRAEIAEAARRQTILASREYAFCLYPAEALRRLLDVPAR